MPIENERKLLLNNMRSLALLQDLQKVLDIQFMDITQGYLSNGARIRHMVHHNAPTNDQFIFTYKQKVMGSCVEIEAPLSSHDYQKLFLIAHPWLVKTRAKFQDGNYTWDIDFFRTPKQGTIYLAMAEVEMPEFEVDCPDILPILQAYAVKWIDNGDKRFNNKNLCNAKKVAKILATF